MCQIRCRGWQFEGLSVMRPAEHLDHDYDTGLIRGMLCIRCNTVREPEGALYDEDVRAAYLADSPAIAAGCSWAYSKSDT